MHIIITGAAVTAILSFLGWVIIYYLIIRTAKKAAQGVKQVLTRKKPVPEPEPVWIAPAKVTKVRTVKIDVAQPAGGKQIDWRALKPNLSKISEKAKSVAAPILRRTEQPSPAKYEDVAMRTYLVAKDGEELGSLTESAIRKMVAAGALSPEDYYLNPTLNEWKPLSEVIA